MDLNIEEVSHCVIALALSQLHRQKDLCVEVSLHLTKENMNFQPPTLSSSRFDPGSSRYCFPDFHRCRAGKVCWAGRCWAGAECVELLLENNKGQCSLHCELNPPRAHTALPPLHCYLQHRYRGGGEQISTRMISIHLDI